MAIGSLVKRLLTIVQKYRYGILILMIGIILMLLPGKKEISEPIENTEKDSYLNAMENRLTEIIGLVDGAGKTRVLLTVMTGEEKIYQVDQETNTDDTRNETKITTIMISNNNKEETGLVRQVIPPSYLGAIVVCQGGNDAKVKLAVVDAVSKVTGLGADKIAVLAMK